MDSFFTLGQSVAKTHQATKSGTASVHLCPDAIHVILPQHHLRPDAPAHLGRCLAPRSEKSDDAQGVSPGLCRLQRTLLARAWRLDTILLRLRRAQTAQKKRESGAVRLSVCSAHKTTVSEPSPHSTVAGASWIRRHPAHVPTRKQGRCVECAT